MFPIFTLLRSLGLPGADERIISLSYPWIGAPRAAILTEGSHPQGESFLSFSDSIELTSLKVTSYLAQVILSGPT